MKQARPDFIHLFIALLLAAAFPLAAMADAGSKPPAYAGTPQAESFALEMAGRGLDAAWVQQTLGEAQKLESVRAAVRPIAGGQRKNWQAYRARFVEPEREAAGREFLRQHEAELTRASVQYGVPVEVIVGILGVETFYGRDTGRYRVVDALATLAFDYPVEDGKDRSAYFREQLAQFFLWCASERCQPLSVTGSYAGAIGLPQFMPGNIPLYGVDFDGDGHVDLNNPADAIGSVARFLNLHGWIQYLDPVFQVNLEHAYLPPLLAPDILPSFHPWQLGEAGAMALNPLPYREKFALVELQNGECDSDYVLGSQNFYVLTRYNRSSYYAMAVLTLGRRVLDGESDTTISSSPTPPCSAQTEVRASAYAAVKAGVP